MLAWYMSLVKANKDFNNMGSAFGALPYVFNKGLSF